MLKLDTKKCNAVSYRRHINHDYGYYIKGNETCHTLQKFKTINDVGKTFDMHPNLMNILMRKLTRVTVCWV
jgi:hypothetical protein